MNKDTVDKIIIDMLDAHFIDRIKYPTVVEQVSSESIIKIIIILECFKKYVDKIHNIDWGYDDDGLIDINVTMISDELVLTFLDIGEPKYVELYVHDKNDEELYYEEFAVTSSNISFIINNYKNLI